MTEPRIHLDFFGLREQPFAPTADPAYFYATRDHKSCLFRLWGSIDERHGIAVVLGNYGTGKTTLLRKLMSGMAAEPERYHTVVLASPIPSWTSFSLLESITQRFGLHPAERSFGAHMEALNEYLFAARDRICTLIIDDAQNLNKRGQLELLRLAQNLETPRHKLLNLVLFAQLEWMEVLRAAPNFHQRVNLTYTLSSISADSVRDMIRYRLSLAATPGRETPYFDDAAIEMIYAFSEGNPRVVVTLCRNALALAAQIESRRIGQEIVLHTIEKTTGADPRKLQEVRALVKVQRVEVSHPIAVGNENRVVPLHASGRGRAFEKRANQLLAQAARTRQR